VDVAAKIVRHFGGIRIETIDWPIILMEFPEERVADPDLHEGLSYIEQLMRECVATRERSYQVTDITRIREMPPASQRKYASEFVTRTSHIAKLGSLGTANVTPSSILRGILTAIFWLTPSPTPTIFCATRNEAYLHAMQVLEGGGARLPPRLIELRSSLEPAARAASGGPSRPRR
jgi:hypothetical protein